MNTFQSKVKYLPLCIVAFALLAVILNSCDQNNYMPKPRGYFRIDLPEHEYRSFDTTFPYSFDYPVYANIVFDEYTQSEPYWLNVHYPQFDGKIHLSYKDLESTSLNDLLYDSREMVYKHAPKAIGIRESLVIDRENQIYGTVYSIEGKDVASPFQFYLTDSTKHFLRGALYFYTRPNNDSLEPVINFIVDDIDHMVGTMQWK